jgi:hypothetical protein
MWLLGTQKAFFPGWIVTNCAATRIYYNGQFVIELFVDVDF